MGTKIITSTTCVNVLEFFHRYCYSNKISQSVCNGQDFQNIPLFVNKDGANTTPYHRFFTQLANIHGEAQCYLKECCYASQSYTVLVSGKYFQAGEMFCEKNQSHYKWKDTLTLVLSKRLEQAQKLYNEHPRVPRHSA